MADLIKFLGTGGARFVVARQLRASGGIWMRLAGVNLLVDPGPGALVRCAQSRPRLDPATLQAVLLSHRHLDHANDANVILEAMTEGGRRPGGVLFCPADALQEEPVVLRYLRERLERVEVLRPFTEYRIGPLRFATRGQHRHGVETYGFVFELDGCRMALISDTAYFPELAEMYRADLWVVNVVRLRSEDSAGIEHLSLDQVEEMVRRAGPRAVVLTHFGMTVLRARPDRLAQAMQERTGVRTIAARDGMSLCPQELIA